MGMNPCLFENSPLGTKRPSRSVDGLGPEEIEISESPITVRARPVATVEDYHNNRVSSERPIAMATISHIVSADTEVKEQLDGHEQAQEEADSSKANMPYSRQPDILTPSSPFLVPDSSTFLKN